jgi:hypothetical protein
MSRRKRGFDHKIGRSSSRPGLPDVLDLADLAFDGEIERFTTLLDERRRQLLAEGWSDAEADGWARSVRDLLGVDG